MPRRNVTGLPLPQPSYTPKLQIARRDGTVEYEDAAKAAAEDAGRARLARNAAEAATDPENCRAATILADKLDYAARGEDPPESCASSGYMRQQCINTVGALWKLHDQVADGSLAIGSPMFRTATILRADWEMPVRDFLETSPSRFLERLRVDLYACGAADAQGALIAGLHGEFAPHSHQVRVHVHMTVIGDMAGCIERLREVTGYSPIVRTYAEQVRKTPTITMSRKPLDNLPDPFTYIIQRYWPSRWEGFIDGVFRRGQKVRIQGPSHTQLLLWLDRWPLQDLTLMMGMRASKDGLVLTKARTALGSL